MVKRSEQRSRIRSVGGGYSARHAERHASRGSMREYAPGWSDGASAAVLAGLHKEKLETSQRLSDTVLELLSPGGQEPFVSKHCASISNHDKDVVRAVLRHHATAVATAIQRGVDGKRLKKMAHSFLKPLRERKAAYLEVEALVVPPLSYPGVPTLRSWLSTWPHADKIRDIGSNRRILEGLAKWPLDWLDGPGVVCYERATSRIERERPGCGGVPPATFVRGLVKTQQLLTATANAADHYVVVEPGERPRFMSVNEVLRGFQVPIPGSLSEALLGPTVSPKTAVECVGRGVHVGVARALLGLLRAEGRLVPGMTYGSAFSGIDTVAAALDVVLGTRWTYRFASESDAATRSLLARAWEARGLQEDACYEDAASGKALLAPAVDLWVATPECREHSPRNHHPDAEAQVASLQVFERSLQYVRARQPRTVIVENVDEPSDSATITGLMARLPGYDRLRTGVLDPRATALAPMARKRRFWVLTAAGAGP